jgi:hypothetical protein
MQHFELFVLQHLYINSKLKTVSPLTPTLDKLFSDSFNSPFINHHSMVTIGSNLNMSPCTKAYF